MVNALSLSGMKKYPYTGAMESAPMAAFLTDFFAGKIEATLKSEEVTKRTSIFTLFALCTQLLP